MPLGRVHVQGRAPAPGVGAVHDVVLDEGEQVEQARARRPPARCPPGCPRGRPRRPSPSARAPVAGACRGAGSARRGSPTRSTARGPLATAPTASGPSVDRWGDPSVAACTRASRARRRSSRAGSRPRRASRRPISPGAGRRGVLVVTSALIDPTASSVRSWVSIEPDPFLWQQPRQPWAGERASLDSRRPGRAVEQPRGGARVGGGLADGCRQVTASPGHVAAVGLPRQVLHGVLDHLTRDRPAQLVHPGGDLGVRRRRGERTACVPPTGLRDSSRAMACVTPSPPPSPSRSARWTTLSWRRSVKSVSSPMISPAGTPSWAPGAGTTRPSGRAASRGCTP